MKAIVSICLMICILPVQLMNETFSKEQSKNYNRLVTIEKLIASNTFMQLSSNRTIFAESLFERRNTLAIHDGYWNEYAQIIGFETQILNQPLEEGQASAFFQEDKYFSLTVNNVACVLSLEPLSGIHPVQVSDKKYLPAEFGSSILDNGFYAYYFWIEDNALLPVENGVNALGSVYVEAGSTLASANKLYGYHADGWVQKNSEFKLLTKSNGKVKISGYYPFSINGSQKGIIYIDDSPGVPFEINEPLFSIELEAAANKIVTIKIQNDFRNDARATKDIRELCFVLTGLTGE